MGAASLEAISRWAESGGPLDIVEGLVIVALFFPVLLLAHETGHALVGLLRTEGLVIVRVGRAPGWLRGRVGRLAFELSPIPSQELAGSATTFARLDRRERIAYALAGPAAELLAVAACVPFILRVPDAARPPFVWALAFGCSHAALNFVPQRIGNFFTDGGAILAAFRYTPADEGLKSPAGSTAPAIVGELQDTQSRWIALFADVKSWARAPHRSSALSGAAWALGLDPQTPPASTAIWHSLAGWCWRECERGDPERRGSATRSEWRRVAQQGFVGSELKARVAATLANDPDLGLGSPGATDTERLGFLARAFDELRPPEGLRALDERDRAFCFRYGVALHDVERLTS